MLQTTRDKWSAIIAEQQTSSLSVKQFCHQQRISTSVFYQRKRALNELAAHKPAQTFVKTKVTKEFSVAGDNTPISLCIGKVCVSLPSSTDANYLVTLIKGINA